MNHRDNVEPSFDARQHEHAEDLLEDYALGTLPADDQAWMETHIASCPECKEELAPLIAALQALPFAAPEPDIQMSDDVWDRIAHSVQKPDATVADDTFVPLESSTVWNLPPERPRTLHVLPRQWLTVAALMLISLIAGTLLGQLLPRFGEDEVQTQQIAIQFTDPNITATGELRYIPDEQVFVLTVNGMPAAPEGHVYQAWLIQGDTPVSAGVMKGQQNEIASVGNRSQFDTFAITVEPGPLGNETPTSEPILVAPLHDNDAG